MLIRKFDGLSREPLGVVDGALSAEIAFDQRGVASATVVLEKGNRHVTQAGLFPGGVGVFYEIDARAEGIEHVWTGRVRTPQATSNSGAVTLRCEGPELWLDRTVTSLPEISGSSAETMRQVIYAHPTPLMLRMGTMSDGDAFTIYPAGSTIWELAESLADDRGEGFTLYPLPGQVEYVLDWWATPYMRDMTAERVLDDQLNCEWTLAYDLAPDLGSLLGVGDSMRQGQSALASTIPAPPGPVIGRKAALEAVLGAPVAKALLGVGSSELRPDIANRAALEAALDQRLRRNLTPTLAGTVELQDEALWGIMPGDLVTTRWADEPTGVFTNAIALVRTAVYALLPQRRAKLSIELWALE